MLLNGLPCLAADQIGTVLAVPIDLESPSSHPDFTAAVLASCSAHS